MNTNSASMNRLLLLTTPIVITNKMSKHSASEQFQNRELENGLDKSQPEHPVVAFWNSEIEAMERFS